MLMRSLQSRCHHHSTALKLTSTQKGRAGYFLPKWCIPTRVRTAYGSVHAAALGPSLACSLPLAERRSQVSVPQKDVLQWYDAQLQRLQQVGDSLAEADGPSREDLQAGIHFSQPHSLVTSMHLNLMKAACM